MDDVDLLGGQWMSILHSHIKLQWHTHVLYFPSVRNTITDIITSLQFKDGILNWEGHLNIQKWGLQGKPKRHNTPHLI